MKSNSEALLQLVPENVLNITGLTDLDAWKEGIRRLKPHSARGIDTISAAELKTLPSEAIADIRDILLSYRQGFPAWFMTARTFAIPKTDTPLDPSMVRPITVLSQLYRLWSQIITRKVLDQLSQKLPYDITGFLPQRVALTQATCFNTNWKKPSGTIDPPLGVPRSTQVFQHYQKENTHKNTGKNGHGKLLS